MRASPIVRSYRIAGPKRVCYRARTVTVAAASKPESEREPEQRPDVEERLHFIPVPQPVVRALLHSFIGLLDFIQKLGARK